MNTALTDRDTLTFTLRPGRLEDLEEAVAMFNLCSRRTSGIEEFTLQEYVAEWTAPVTNLESDTRVAVTPEGKIVGVIEVWNTAPPYVLNWVWARVHPEYEGHGIGTALMLWAEGRAREFIALAAPDTRVVLRAGEDPSNLAAKALFESLDIPLVRHSFTMEVEHREPPAAPDIPEGIVIRPMVAPDEYEEIHRLDMEAFRDHWGFVERPFDVTFNQMMHFIRERGTHDPSLWFVAMDGDRMAGISTCDLEARGDALAGYVDTLAVRREYRHRGIGLALLLHSFGELYRRGQHKVQLGVDAFNLTGALRLYRKAGMDVIRQFDIYEKELRPGRNLITS
jgi:ribosomal protein S18 acetylase RimI-like enzyme